MKYEIREKEIHDHIIFYKEGVIEDYSHLSEFILKAGEECLKLNPSIKCEEPDYCYVEYLDKGYKEKDVKIRYSQAVTRFGKEGIISTPSSSCPIIVVPTDEELMIARDTVRLLKL